MENKLCFVIMGFGKKTDPSTGITFDLDKTYKNIIQPAVQQAGYTCVRGDEIKDSGTIDKSMYALLMYADLVIADISTYNPNAIYELGVRHAVKPFSTIIMKEQRGSIAFDLNHTRIFNYSHFGDDIGKDESERCILELKELIQNVSKNTLVDSPMYEHLHGINPPILTEDQYKRIIGDLAEKEEKLFTLAEAAKNYLADSDFENAKKYWKKASKLLPTENYFKQQLALATYKSKSPSEFVALTDALNIIEDLLPSKDPETLGITGAIYKNLYFLNNDVESLNRAIDYYGSGFKFRNDYYNGENYAFCLNLKSSVESNEEEKIYYKIEAKKTRERIIKTLEEEIEKPDFYARADIKWIYATLAQCYFFIRNLDLAQKYEDKFKELAVEWEIQTYTTSKEHLMKLEVL